MLPVSGMESMYTLLHEQGCMPQVSCDLHFVYFVGKYTINIQDTFLLGLLNDISSKESTKNQTGL
jgi:hypothetical protein